MKVGIGNGFAIPVYGSPLHGPLGPGARGFVVYSHPPAAMFVLVVISVVLTVWWLGIETAYVYLYHTLGLSFDVSLLFFTGSYDYFFLVNGFALYFVLDIVYNRLFGKSGGKRRLNWKEKRNYHHLCSSSEAKKGLCRLEFDCMGHLCNVDYRLFEILVGKGLVVTVLFCLLCGVRDKRECGVDPGMDAFEADAGG